MLTAPNIGACVAVSHFNVLGSIKWSCRPSVYQKTSEEHAASITDCHKSRFGKSMTRKSSLRTPRRHEFALASQLCEKESIVTPIVQFSVLWALTRLKSQEDGTTAVVSLVDVEMKTSFCTRQVSAFHNGRARDF